MKLMLTMTATAALFAMSTVSASPDPESQARLLAEAKIGAAQAKTIALAQVKNGVVNSAELEREHGRLIWSFDVKQPSATGVTEIQVDAKTGKVMSTRHETEAAEANERKAERHEAKPR